MNNQIKLNAEYEDARKVASCYVGVEVESRVAGFLDSVSYDYENSVYVFRTQEIYVGNSRRANWSRYKQDSITIDTSVNQPCIYMCMKHGLRVEVEDEYFETTQYDLSELDDKRDLMSDTDLCGIKSIKILGLEDMKGVEIG